MLIKSSDFKEKKKFFEHPGKKRQVIYKREKIMLPSYFTTAMLCDRKNRAT